MKLTHCVVDISLGTHEDGQWVNRKDIDMATPSFTVLADPDGNRACIGTAPGRG